MKFMLNGALTVGTLDGANIEIADLVGMDNIFIFGLQAPEIKRLRKKGYNPHDYIEKSPMLKDIYKMLTSNFFSPNKPGLFDPIVQYINNGDQFCVCADFDYYLNVQENVSRQYQDMDEWIKKSIINVAKSGMFSSDRTIKEYAEGIWKVGLQQF